MMKNHLIDIPKEHVKSSRVNVKAVEISDGILAPYFFAVRSAKCYTVGIS